MLKRFILWDFPRGSRQYDLMVGLILAFIFLTPRELFRDQPVLPKAASITRLPSDTGNPQFLVDAATLESIPENQRLVRLTTLLRSRTGTRTLAVTRVEPILDSEGELQGSIAFARP
jgi:hypothetical protein